MVRIQIQIILELHAHFKGFVCMHMRKLHEEYQVLTDAKLCSHLIVQNSKYLTTKQLSRFCLVIG